MTLSKQDADALKHRKKIIGQMRNAVGNMGFRPSRKFDTAIHNAEILAAIPAKIAAAWAVWAISQLPEPVRTQAAVAWEEGLYPNEVEALRQ